MRPFLLLLLLGRERESATSKIFLQQGSWQEKSGRETQIVDPTHTTPHEPKWVITVMISCACNFAAQSIRKSAASHESGAVTAHA
jgi:hypothetical protein